MGSHHHGHLLLSFDQVTSVPGFKTSNWRPFAVPANLVPLDTSSSPANPMSISIHLIMHLFQPVVGFACASEFFTFLFSPSSLFINELLFSSVSSVSRFLECGPDLWKTTYTAAHSCILRIRSGTINRKREEIAQDLAHIARPIRFMYDFSNYVQRSSRLSTLDSRLLTLSIPLNLTFSV